MSDSEVAVQSLRRSLVELIPALLASLSNLHQQHPADLTPDQTFATLRPIVATPEVKQALTGSTAGESAAESSVRLRNLCFEVSRNELRKLVIEPANSHFDLDSTGETLSQAALRDIFDHLDSILALALEDLVDDSLLLSIFEELIEANPVPTCSRLFEYVESRVKQLTIRLVSGRGKGLVLLRTCNELLRRLSKPSQAHAVFAGRILGLQAAVFGLGERGGTNFRGEFNIENQTIIEAQDENDDVKERTVDDNDKDDVFRFEYPFYEQFWKVQRFFANPRLLMVSVSNASKPATRTNSPTPGVNDEGDAHIAEGDSASEGAKGPMAEFRIITKKIMDLFSAVAKRERELAGAAATDGAKDLLVKKTRRGQMQASPGVTGYFAGQSISDATDDNAHRAKRLKPDIVDGAVANDTETSTMDQITDGQGAESEGRLFFPKYLTGRRLLEYEVRDVSFRKHILVQFLVLFQYLLSLSARHKVLQKTWTNTYIQQKTFTLDNADEDWIRGTFPDLQELLRDMQPDGYLFVDTVREVLKRETNWLRWKEANCPSIEKPPLSPEQISEYASARARLLKKPTEFPHKLGTAALSELWEDGLSPPVAGTRTGEDELGNEITIPTDGLEELEISPPVPSLEHYSKSIKREEMKIIMRKKQLDIDPEVAETDLSPELRVKLDQDEKIQATIEATQSLAWRALRIASRDNLHLFNRLKQPDSIEELLIAMEKDRDLKSKRKSLARSKLKTSTKGVEGGHKEDAIAKQAELATEASNGTSTQNGDAISTDTQDGTETQQGELREDHAVSSLFEADQEAESNKLTSKAEEKADGGQDVDMDDATS